MNNSQQGISLREYIKTKHDAETARITWNHEKTLHKIARQTNHLIFNIRCSKAGLLPSSIQILPPIRTKRGYDIAEKAAGRFLRERILVTHFKKAKLKKEAEELRKNLARRLDWKDYDAILEKHDLCAEKTFNNTKKPHIEKFRRMQKNTTHWEQQQEIDLNKWVVKLSSRTLTDAEEQVLRRGLNFAPTPRRIPYIDIVAAVEGVTRHLNTEEANELRGSVCSLLKRARPPSSNMDKEERAALKTFRQDKNIVVLPADKGNATVVMDSARYEEKVTSLLEDPIYKRFKRDPTAATERKVLKEVRELEKKELIPRNLGSRIKPSASKSPNYAVYQRFIKQTSQCGQ